MDKLPTESLLKFSQDLDNDIDTNTKYESNGMGQVIGLYEKGTLVINIMDSSEAKVRQKIKLKLIGIMTAFFRPKLDN